jgi:uncharacterized membrane protein required for colicin V production
MNDINLPMTLWRRVALRTIMTWLSGFWNSVTSVLGSMPISWVDFVTLIIVCVGFIHGRKRGLSEELLDTIQWIAIIVVGALFYRLLANAMTLGPLNVSLATYCVLSYIIIALVIKILFVLFKRRFGQKLVESDIFGRFEFYGGMGAGALRWACMYLFFLSILHAPSYTAEELAQRQKEVEYNFGNDFFPSISKIQETVFKNSLTGRGVDTYLGRFLLEPSSADVGALRGDNSMAKRRERDVDVIMGGK